MKIIQVLTVLAVIAVSAFGETPQVGMTESQVLEIKGAPKSTLTAGSKAIYRWSDMEVTLRDGKVTNVQPLSIRSEKRVRLRSYPSPLAGETGEPGVHVLHVTGSVMQVLDNGVLLSTWQIIPAAGKPGTPVKGQQPLFVVGTASNLVDGSDFDATIFPAGRYKYTNVNNSVSTIFRYATTARLASEIEAAEEEQK